MNEIADGHQAENDAPDLATRRGCAPKTGWLSGETYCDVHGREAGWPCAVTMSVILPGVSGDD